MCCIHLIFRCVKVMADPASARQRPLQSSAVNSRPDGQIPVGVISISPCTSSYSISARSVAVSSPDVSFHFISGAANREAECGYVDTFLESEGPVLPSRGKRYLGKHICRLFLPALGICGPSFFWNW